MSNPFEDYRFYSVPDAGQGDIYISGENQKGLVVLYRAQKDPEASKLLLQKIVAAVKMDPQRDAVFIDLAGQPSVSLFSMGLDPLRYILLFGLAPEEVGLHIHFEKYRSLPINKARLIVSDSTEALEAQPALKKALWEELKRMFDLYPPESL